MKTENWIFILTNRTSYKDVSRLENIPRGVDELDQATPILNSSFEQIYLPIKSLKPGLYIVFDDYTGFTSLCKEIGDSNKIFILTHTNCELNYETLSRKKIGVVRSGQHAKGELNGRFYPNVIEILEKGKSANEIYKEVWSVVFADHPLEEKLNVLHLCLTPAGVKHVLTKKLHKKIGLEENILKQLSRLHDPCSDVCLSILTEIRKKVLADK